MQSVYFEKDKRNYFLSSSEPYVDMWFWDKDWKMLEDIQKEGGEVHDFEIRYENGDCVVEFETEFTPVDVELKDAKRVCFRFERTDTVGREWFEKVREKNKTRHESNQLLQPFIKEVEKIEKEMGKTVEEFSLVVEWTLQYEIQRVRETGYRYSKEKEERFTGKMNVKPLEQMVMAFPKQIKFEGMAEGTVWNVEGDVGNLDILNHVIS